MAHQSGTAFPSAARTATPTPFEFDVQPDVQYLSLVIAVSAVTSTPSTTFNVEAQDDLGTWYVMLVSAAIVGVGTTVLLLGPDVTTAANVAAQVVLPQRVRIRPVHGNANSQTYTVRYRLR